MTNRAESRFHFFLGKSEPFRQRIQRGVARNPRARDGSVTLALSVARIINKQECIIRIWVARQDRRPVECKRTVAAKRDPKPTRQSSVISCRDIKRRLFAERQQVRNFFAVRR